MRMLARIGMNARLHGAGVVVDQEPEAGSPIDRGAMATLKLERHPAVDAAVTLASDAAP